MTAIVLVACWGGARRSMHPVYQQDHSYYLRQWADALSELEHEADVCFVSNGSDSPEYDMFLDALRDSEWYRVVDHENAGHSQGAWAAGWRASPGYDHYIVVEDDYVPALSRFDQVMIDMIEEIGCDYLCQYLWEGVVPMMNGIMTAACLARMGGLPGEACHGQAQADDQQYRLGMAMRAAGLRVSDMGDRFKLLIPGDGRHNDLVYHEGKEEVLFKPLTFYGRP